MQEPVLSLAQVSNAGKESSISKKDWGLYTAFLGPDFFKGSKL